MARAYTVLMSRPIRMGARKGPEPRWMRAATVFRIDATSRGDARNRAVRALVPWLRDAASGMSFEDRQAWAARPVFWEMWGPGGVMLGSWASTPMGEPYRPSGSTP